jgi:hypothetical protein
MKKTLIACVLVLVSGGLAVMAFGGMSWVDEMGLRGPQRTLERRIVGYWEARMEGNLEQIAQFVHPQQSSVLDPGMLSTEAYEINTISMEGEEATVALTVQSRLKHPIFADRQREVELASKWVRYEGKWYLDIQPVGYHQAIQFYKGQWSPEDNTTVDTIDDTMESAQVAQ